MSNTTQAESDDIVTHAENRREEYWRFRETLDDEQELHMTLVGDPGTNERESNVKTRR